MLDLSGIFKAEHWRDNQLLQVFEGHNIITRYGKIAILDEMFVSSAGIPPWYMALLDSGDDDTGHIQVDYDEENISDFGDFTYLSEFTSYTGNRPSWGAGASGVSGGYVECTNGTQVEYAITATGKVTGIALVDADTGSPSVFWSSAAFDNSGYTWTDVNNGDTIKVTYTVRTAL